MRCRDLISSSDFERTDTLSFAKKAAQAPVSIKSIAGKVCADRGIVLDTQLTASTSSQKMWTLEEGYLSRDLSRISPIHTPEWLKLCSFGAQAIQCDERDAPQCFLCQPTSKNNSAREGSTAGALASKLNLRNISLAALKECTHNPSFSGGDGFMMKQDDEWLLQSWDFHHSIKRLQKTTTPTPCSQNNRTRLRI